MLIILINLHPGIFSQDSTLYQLVSVPDTSCRLDIALRIIENNIHHFFSYNSNIIPVEKIVTLPSVKDTLISILRTIINDPDIQYKVIGNQVVIYNPLNENPVDYMPDTGIVGSSFKIINGIIVDGSSNDPIPFATIGLTRTTVGTISNSNGEFVFKFPRAFIHDSLVVACLGYAMKKIRITDLDSGYCEIMLLPDYIPIQEVIIRKTDPIYLLRLALSKIPDNYFTEPVNQTTFYRESVKRGNRYLMISEAVLEIYRSGYFEQFPYDQVRIIKARKNIDIQRTDTVTLKLKAGLRTSLLLDIVRNRLDFLNEDLFNLYNYDMTDIIVDEDRYTYVIYFRQYLYTTPPHYEGRIFIDLESLAIRAFEFQIYPGTIEQAAKYLVIRKPRYMDVTPLSAKYYVRYRQDEDKFYLAYILSDNTFRIKRRHQLVGKTFNTKTEMAITQTRIENVTRFKTGLTTNIDDLFIDHVGGADESFWGDYNYIKPDEPLEEALIRIDDLMKKGR
ncbi:MAG: hypothetical protein AMS27_11125 [Bacteroides sp. SM23_62_1]|nr:MAG: hypothetical protein AMS27_11125 [Bacteroides sp. SM23_62_1]